MLTNLANSWDWVKHGGVGAQVFTNGFSRGWFSWALVRTVGLIRGWPMEYLSFLVFAVQDGVVEALVPAWFWIWRSSYVLVLCRSTVVLTEGLSREWSSKGFGLVHICSQRLWLRAIPAVYKKALYFICILFPFSWLNRIPCLFFPRNPLHHKK